MMKKAVTVMAMLALGLMMAGGAQAQSDDCDQIPNAMQLRTHNFEDANGLDGNGGIHRHGGDFVGEGGPHGPLGTGPDDELLKFLGMDEMIMLQNGMLFGFMSVYHYGPGESQVGVEDPGHFGPNTSGEGYGAAGENQNAMNQPRSGRR
jgi:hypothetical protein|nr:hypothetical protein [Candidatus Krumholzibacteria bacterium]